MNRNLLYLLVGALIVALGVVGYMYYQESQPSAGIDINVDDSGISIEAK